MLSEWGLPVIFQFKELINFLKTLNFKQILKPSQIAIEKKWWHFFEISFKKWKKLDVAYANIKKIKLPNYSV